MFIKRLENLTLADVICRLANLVSYNKSSIFGTLLFKTKAIIFGVRVSSSVKCFGAVHIVRAPRSEIIIGKGVTFVSSTTKYTASSIYAPVLVKTLSRSAKIIIGNSVSLNGTSIVARSRVIRIGDGTMIAPNVVILDSDFHAQWPPEGRVINPDFESDADVTIGENVWVGIQCIILKGVHIGENSIIAAGSVVTSDIPANVMAAGVPAKIIKQFGGLN